MSKSRLYFGTVSHRRVRPRVHALKYRLFWTLLNIDEISELSRQSALFSHNRFNLLSFHDADHGDGSGAPIRPQIERMLLENRIDFDGGSILLFCMPRVFGYGFNPISVYFCHFRNGQLAAIIYEVHNTFGERHSYIFDSHEKASPGAHGCEKRFHVSPFMDLGMRYEFRTLLPADRFALGIRGLDDNGILIHASLAGQAKPFTTKNLVRCLLLYPLATLKVIAAIHWNALQLWFKGIRIRHKPTPPTQSTTAISSIPRS